MSLHVAVQLSQHHLLKTLSFFLLYILVAFVKDYLNISMWVYFWAFHWSIYLFLCQYHTVLITVTLQYILKSRRVMPLALFLFLRNHFKQSIVTGYHFLTPFPGNNKSPFRSDSWFNPIQTGIPLAYNLLLFITLILHTDFLEIISVFLSIFPD